jgi:NhaA family Na+:H+ antiporter
MSAGVALGGFGALVSGLSHPVAVGIIAGLVLGKPIGITAATWLVARFTHARIDAGLAWIDVFGLSVLAGIGFTVSLLIGELAFGPGTEQDDQVKVAVLIGTVVAAALAAVILRLRNRVYRRIYEEEHVDRDGDDIPDVYQG